MPGGEGNAERSGDRWCVRAGTGQVEAAASGERERDRRGEGWWGRLRICRWRTGASEQLRLWLWDPCVCQITVLPLYKFDPEKPCATSVPKIPSPVVLVWVVQKCSLEIECSSG